MCAVKGDVLTVSDTVLQV